MNSGFSVNNPLQWKQLLTECAVKAHNSGTRTLFITCSTPGLGIEWFAKDIECEHLPAHSVADRSDRISALLGTQRLALILSTGVCPDAGVLAAAAGTVAAGGYFLLDISALRSAFEQTCVSDTDDADSQHQTTRRYSRSVYRFIRLLKNTAERHSETVHFIDLANYTGTMAGWKMNLHDSSHSNMTNSTEPIANPLAAIEQDKLLNEACRHLFTNRQTCTLIKGRRGRGKSSLLGRIAQTLTDRQIEYKVTALQKSALSSFKQRVASLDTHFVSTQNALKEKTEFLLVDEAANLSIAQLHSFLRHCKHVVLCTTTEGYEVAGRALDIRLLDSLEDTNKQILSIEPIQSWRWHDEDPLAGFTDQLLLNNLQKPDAVSPGYTQEASLTKKAVRQCTILQLSQDALADDETLLASLHSLLNETHYQSTTKDLANLLDTEQLQIWVQSFEGAVAAALLAQHEGNIPACLHKDIREKKRRLPDQLLPQLLAQMADSTLALEKNYLRIVRIAVLPSMRRHKLASQLLNAVIEANISDANTRHNGASTFQPSGKMAADAIGASFAADAVSIAFWKYHGFAEFHRGYKANPRTGRSSIAVMRCFESRCENAMNIARAIHHSNDCAREAIHSGVEGSSIDTTLTELDKQLLSRFSNGQRSMNDTLGPLYKLSAYTQIPLTKPAGTSRNEFEKLLRDKIRPFTCSDAPAQAK